MTHRLTGNDTVAGDPKGWIQVNGSYGKLDGRVCTQAYSMVLSGILDLGT